MSDLEIGLIILSSILSVIAACLGLSNHYATKLMDSLVETIRRLEESIEPLQQRHDFYRDAYLKMNREFDLVQIKSVESQDELKGDTDRA